MKVIIMQQERMPVMDITISMKQTRIFEVGGPSFMLTVISQP